MKIKKRYTPYVIIVIIILVIAAVTAIICISNSRKSKYHGLKSSQELEKEYFDAFSDYFGAKAPELSLPQLRQLAPAYRRYAL